MEWGTEVEWSGVVAEELVVWDLKKKDFFGDFGKFILYVFSFRNCIFKSSDIFFYVNKSLFKNFTEHQFVYHFEINTCFLALKDHLTL